MGRHFGSVAVACWQKSYTILQTIRNSNKDEGLKDRHNITLNKQTVFLQLDSTGGAQSFQDTASGTGT